ncbi:ABC transporter substrate-binding protein [Mycolicibacterium brumae]|uniref:Thiamine pyrimidine synthase n=1 Tax=Mycolicibacterium brumae TaxID=85968 RepID=A0A2G5PDW8_9MYCO|nr:ABC transporter substrate-binding protein [Mycolicibacterium brumae]MCV7191841.1 ABC transporter substrate-binding protein [Mycolicibacterium brumae]PIB76280.1 ABC transporter permease [Mycolicibacterium brumae]RWA15780.1 ABC transporter permease [Mycolicibacterium brumae DSM 44177]UWW07147.1 ABC transporter substrate-binding protein [Mycolicibacterium brumae]
MNHSPSIRRPFAVRRLTLLAATALTLTMALTGALTGCAGSDPEGAEGQRTTVRFALDWTPNTNHTGLYVAMNRGYFADAGIDVEVLPYNNTNPEVLVDAGQAEFGISFQDTATMSMATGADLRSVLAVEQTWATEVAVLADRDDITSPADLDGLTFGGFDNPAETVTMRGVVQAAGGKGDFETVVLGTTAYEALYSGDVDFTVPYVAWEGLEAKRRGVELKTFAYTDYGFPDAYAVVVVGNRTWLSDNPDAARAFVGALRRGYQDAIDDPAAAAAILQQENSGLLTDLDLLVESQQLLAEKYMLDENGEFGRQTLEHWSELGAFLYDSGLLTDRDGAPLREAPDWSTFFSNEYL